MPRKYGWDWDADLNDQYCSDEHEWYFLYEPNKPLNTCEDEYNVTEGNHVLIITAKYEKETRRLIAFSTVCEIDKSESSHYRPRTEERYIMVREQKEYLSYLSAHITDNPAVLVQSYKEWETAEKARQAKIEEERQLHARMEAEKRKVEEIERRNHEEIKKKYQNGEYSKASEAVVARYYTVLTNALKKGKARTVRDLVYSAAEDGVDLALLQKQICPDLPKEILKDYYSTSHMRLSEYVAASRTSHVMGFPELLVAARACQFLNKTIDFITNRSCEKLPCVFIANILPYSLAGLAPMADPLKSLIQSSGYQVYSIDIDSSVDTAYLSNLIEQADPFAVIILGFLRNTSPDSEYCVIQALKAYPKYDNLSLYAHGMLMDDSQLQELDKCQYVEDLSIIFDLLSKQTNTMNIV